MDMELAAVNAHRTKSGRIRSVGRIAAEIAANVRFQRRVINLCKRPRLVGELLARLGAERSITSRIDQLLEELENLDPEALELAGGDRFPPLPIHGVER